MSHTPDWARTCYACLVVVPKVSLMRRGPVSYGDFNQDRPVCVRCVALPVGTRPTELPEYEPVTYVRPTWSDDDDSTEPVWRCEYCWAPYTEPEMTAPHDSDCPARPL